MFVPGRGQGVRTGADDAEGFSPLSVQQTGIPRRECLDRLLAFRPVREADQLPSCRLKKRLRVPEGLISSSIFQFSAQMTIA